jgi:hypothetical protein
VSYLKDNYKTRIEQKINQSKKSVKRQVEKAITHNNNLLIHCQTIQIMAFKYFVHQTLMTIITARILFKATQSVKHTKKKIFKLHKRKFSKQTKFNPTFFKS